MRYTLITDEDGVRNAFEKFCEIFREGAEELTEIFSCTRYLHRNRRLWGAFGERKNRYLTMFGRDENNKILFLASIPKTGDNFRYGRALFVQDETEGRFLAHLGTFHPKHPEKGERLDKFTDSWIDVPGVKYSSFPITHIDNVDTTALVDGIDRFAQIIEGEWIEGSVKREARSALNTILCGPPGTGKTYDTFRRCVEICDGSCPNGDDKVRARYKELVEEGRIEFVTFHQSYGYEEFVEGLRPDADSAKEDGVAGAGFRLVATPGVLKRIANRARGPSRPTGEAEASADTKPHVLVIDEINRANISKVMGELITLLEEDKREGAENEVAVTLPHSGDRFTLPANLYILGTMNTADRSIALLDTALRRRFEFEELAPDPDLLSDAAKATGIDLPAMLRTINERLEYLVDRDHLIGHAWLMRARTKADVDRIMRHKIIPLIAEYFYDDWQKVRAVLGGTDDFVQGETLNPPPGLDDTDAGEDRRRWTVRDEFEEGAYDRLIAEQAQGPE